MKTWFCNQSSYLSAVFILFCLLILSGECNAQSANSANDPKCLVTRVNDGDTITVSIDGQSERIRLLGIDAPELGQKPWGQRAMRFLQTLVKESGNMVRIEYDVMNRDKHGRLLAYVRTRDGLFINKEMLEKGLAMLFTVPPNVKYVSALQAAQSIARQKKLGIWGPDGLSERPSDYRKSHPRN